MSKYTFELCAVVAATPNGDIGVDNTIPWRLQGDLKRFRELTEGHVVIMGRKTYESLPGALKNRVNIVISGSGTPIRFTGADSVYVVRNIEEALEVAQSLNPNRAFVIGGANVYAAMIPMCTRLYWTKVLSKDPIPYDASIPNFDRLRDGFYIDHVVASGFDTHVYVDLVRNANGR